MCWQKYTLRNILDLVDGNTLYFDLESGSKTINDKLDIMGVKNIPIIIDKPAVSIAEVEEITRRMVKENNIKIVMIDYLQLIAKPNNEDILEILNRITRELGITIIITSQLSRMLHGKDITIPQLIDCLKTTNKSILDNSDVIIVLTFNITDNVIKIQATKGNVNPIFVEDVKYDPKMGLLYNE